MKNWILLLGALFLLGACGNSDELQSAEAEASAEEAVKKEEEAKKQAELQQKQEEEEQRKLEEEKRLKEEEQKRLEEEKKLKEEEQKRLEEEKKRLEEQQKIPNDEEVKGIIEQSYKFLDIIQEHSVQLQQNQPEPFLAALQPYFTEAYIVKINPVDYSVPTDGVFPTGFNYERHFEIKTRTSENLTAEVFSTGYYEEPIIYTITAKKENNNWKIDGWEYREDESSEAEGGGLATEEEARQLIATFLQDYKSYDITSISLHDNNTFFVEAYIYASEEHMNAVYLAVDRTTRAIRQVDIFDEEFFGS